MNYKIATLFQEQDPRQLSEERYSEDSELEAKLLEYWRTAAVILPVPGATWDKLAPSVKPAVPLSYQSDRQWIWPSELSYYLSEHGLLPPAELVEHILTVGAPGELTESESKTARDFLLASAPVPEPMRLERQQELTGAAAPIVAALAHEDWRKPRKLADGSFELRFKEVKDQA